jgi:hypothetical protein
LAQERNTVGVEMLDQNKLIGFTGSDKGDYRRYMENAIPEFDNKYLPELTTVDLLVPLRVAGLENNLATTLSHIVNLKHTKQDEKINHCGGDERYLLEGCYVKNNNSIRSLENEQKTTTPQFIFITNNRHDIEKETIYNGQFITNRDAIKIYKSSWQNTIRTPSTEDQHLKEIILDIDNISEFYKEDGDAEFYNAIKQSSNKAKLFLDCNYKLALSKHHVSVQAIERPDSPTIGISIKKNNLSINIYFFYDTTKVYTEHLENDGITSKVMTVTDESLKDLLDGL